MSFSLQKSVKPVLVVTAMTLATPLAISQDDYYPDPGYGRNPPDPGYNPNYDPNRGYNPNPDYNPNPRYEPNPQARRPANPDRYGFGRKRNYFSAGVAIGFDNFDDDSIFQGIFPKPDIDVDTSVGFGFRIGQRVMPQLAVEAAFDYQTQFKVKNKDNDRSLDIDIWSLMVNVKGYLPSGPFQPYLLAGMGAIGVDADGAEGHTNFGGKFGGGVDIYLNRSVFLNAEGAYYLPSGSNNDFQYGAINFGLGVKF